MILELKEVWEQKVVIDPVIMEALTLLVLYVGLDQYVPVSELPGRRDTLNPIELGKAFSGIILETRILHGDFKFPHS